MNFNPHQQEPGMFPVFDQIESRVHGSVAYILAACFAIGGFFYGLSQTRFPVVIYVGLGLVIGLLFVTLLNHLMQFLTLAALVAAAGLGTYWLLSHETALRQKGTPAIHAAPAAAPPSFWDYIPGGRP